jgi:hypothetical protein
MNIFAKMLGKVAVPLSIPLIMPFIKKEIMIKIDCDEFKKKTIKIINEKIDIPNLSEEKEEQIIEALYEAAREIAKNNIDKVDLNSILKAFKNN